MQRSLERVGKKVIEIKEGLSRSMEAAIFAFEKESAQKFGKFMAVRGKLDGRPVEIRIKSGLQNRTISYTVNGERCELRFNDSEEDPFDRHSALNLVSERLTGRLDHEYIMLHDQTVLCNRGPVAVLVGVRLGPKKKEDPNERAWG